MGLAAPRNTLSHQLARPLCTAANMAWVPVSVTAKRVQEMLNVHKTDGREPEIEALRFYLLQHAMAIVRNRRELDEPLGEYEEVAELYHSECSDVATRIFTYLFLITVREFRHGSVSCHTRLGNKFGDAIVKFRDTIKGHPSGGVLGTLFNHAPNMNLGTYCEAIEWTFRNGKFGGGFGGKPWANITSVLRRYVSGEFTAEMMLDTAFTLAHNNGTMFNKGYGWSVPNKSTLLTILDIQASGQIPQLCADIQTGAVPHAPGVDSEILKLYDKLAAILGEDFKGYVDWVKVEADAPGHRSYAIQKSHQFAKHGKSPLADELEAFKAAKLDAAQKAAFAKKAKAMAAQDAAQAAALEGKTQIDIWNVVTNEEPRA